MTARARTWLTRAMLITLLAGTATLAGATWALSGTAWSTLRRPPPGPGGVSVLAVSGDTVTLSADAGTLAPGTWDLVTAGGRAVIGEIIGWHEDSVTRVLASGEVTVGPGAVFDRFVFGPDPAAAGLDFAEVILEGPAGDLAAWMIPGADDTWVVMLHDFAADRTETLRAARVAASLGLPVLVPVQPGGDGFSPGAWREAAAALDFALGSGASDLVVYGFGSGGSTALLTVSDARYASQISAVVLDAPLLDPGGIVDGRLAEDKVPGFLVGWAKAAATFRFGLDWSGLDQLARAPMQRHPVLVFHGLDDGRYPGAASRTYADAVPRGSAVLVAGAGHGEAWNVDPSGYEQALSGFLRDAVVGPAGP